MSKSIWVLSMLSTLMCANIFTITDRNGKVTHTKDLQHTTNAYLSQKATDYSLQAIYDALHREENLARAAQAAKKEVTRLAKLKKEAQKKGKTYHLTNKDKNALLEYAKYFKGVKYVWGGTTPKGFDCSGYVQFLYKKHNINLPRTAWSQSQKGVSVAKNDLKKGDLLFFLTDKKRGIPVTHVGIYIGNGEFIHAASKKKGIIISPIYSGYYASKFVSAKRVLAQS
ncbi:MAG: C40 family peptidase [Sulfurovum sp.]|nr:C40 family peptidase [Sulfurovum sp.]